MVLRRCLVPLEPRDVGPEDLQLLHVLHTVEVRAVVEPRHQASPTTAVAWISIIAPGGTRPATPTAALAGKFSGKNSLRIWLNTG